MNKVTIAEYRDQISSVSDAVTSLASCTESEIPNEMRIVHNALSSLDNMLCSTVKQHDVERQMGVVMRLENVMQRRGIDHV